MIHDSLPFTNTFKSPILPPSRETVWTRTELRANSDEKGNCFSWWIIIFIIKNNCLWKGCSFFFCLYQRSSSRYQWYHITPNLYDQLACRLLSWVRWYTVDSRPVTDLSRKSYWYKHQETKMKLIGVWRPWPSQGGSSWSKNRLKPSTKMFRYQSESNKGTNPISRDPRIRPSGARSWSNQKQRLGGHF